jgi:Trk-type K+ transport system membrane component
MKFVAVQKVLGLLLTLFSVTMLPPIIVGLIYRDGEVWPFLAAFLLILGIGLLTFLPVMRLHQELRIRDGFLVVVLFWTGLGLAGALPFVLAEVPRLSVTDAIFESMSGLTTTGATVIVGLDAMPKAILFYRQQLQWFGGHGDHRACGRRAADAGSRRHAALSRRDARPGEGSQAHAQDHRFHRLDLGVYRRDSELRFFLFLMATATAITTLALFYTDTYITWDDAFTNGLFQAVSIGTTAGFTTAEIFYWPPFIEILLLFASFVGGCASSTGGGIKVIRFLLLIKQGIREIERLIHPSAQIPVRVGGKSVNHRVVDAVWGFFSLYVASFVIMYLLLAATDMDLLTSFSAVAACINNLGPGLAQVGANYAELYDPAKWILCVAMLLGRLEIFTLLVLLTPAFWQR